MPFPHFPEKHKYSGILKAEDMISRRGKVELNDATSAVLCFQSSPLKYLSRQFGGKKVGGFSGNVLMLRKTGFKTVVAQTNGFGSPAVAIMLEELAASGIKSCIAIGAAGALQDSIASGDIIVPTGAIRDEGTSYHYLSADDPARPSNEIFHRLINVLTQRNQRYFSGQVWTTDAPYRETAEEISRYRHDGLLAVDMETSAFLCVCSALKMQAACGLVAADSLGPTDSFGTGATWRPPTDNKKVESSLRQLADTAVEALTV